MPLHVSSTCAHHQEVKIALHSLWYHHTCRWPSRAQVEGGLQSMHYITLYRGCWRNESLFWGFCIFCCVRTFRWQISSSDTWQHCHVQSGDLDVPPNAVGSDNHIYQPHSNPSKPGVTLTRAATYFTGIVTKRRVRCSGQAVFIMYCECVFAALLAIIRCRIFCLPGC